MFNYTGGLSLGPEVILGGVSTGPQPVDNEIWSPQIQWDLPGTDDDGSDVAGAVLEFDVWKDLPLSNGIFYGWSVRSAQPGQPFRAWEDRTSVYYDAGVGRVWKRHREVISDLLVTNPERVQIAFAARDYAGLWGLPGNAATPSPAFDNVVLRKVRLHGPVISTRTIDLAQDGFPPSGSKSTGSQADRDALDIPFDMARDVNSGLAVLDPGDSVIVDVVSNIPGAWVGDVRMVWALRTNPLFEDAIRSAPARPVDENVVAGAAGTVWTGEVVASQSTTSAGYPVDDRWFVDLPDVDFLYPGDVLHYYVQATDTEGRVSTLPADLHDFGDFSPGTGYDRRFVVRGLPSLQGGGVQPEVLVVNDHGHGGDEAEWVRAFRELGLEEGVHFDSYTVRGPESLVSNGIGATGGHGASAGQLFSYEVLFYLSGDLDDGLLSFAEPEHISSDKGNDLMVLDQWLVGSAPRHLALFGDNVASAIAGPYSSAFMDIHMGVDAGTPDVSPLIGGQLAPRVVPNPQSAFAWALDASFVAYGGCTSPRAFDRIQPTGLGEVAHWFTDPGGTPITSPTAGAASVVNVRPNGVSVTFPYAWSAVYPLPGRSTGPTVQADLLEDVFDLFAVQWALPPVTDAPPPRRSVELSVAPNPFNPRTTIEFTAPAGSRGTVKVYTLRGELVQMLHSGEFHATRFVWDGTDRSGAAVASGVYVVRAEADGVRKSAKVALVK